MTRLTVPITATTLEQAIEDLRRAKDAGADLAEIRLDHLAPCDLHRLAQESPLPILWTLRHSSEGGKFDGTVEEQFNRLTQAIEIGGEYVDVEYHRWINAPAAQPTLLQKIAHIKQTGRTVRLILSAHDFSSTPSDLPALAKKIADQPDADIVKIACKADTIHDLFPILDLMKHSPKPVIAISMGEHGVASRLLARKFQTELTFASLSDEKASAPGQLTIEETTRLYNWDRLNSQTKLAAVVGHPVGHSLSPVMHNRAYERMNLDGLYLKFDIPESYEDFERFIDLLRSRPWLNVMGLSITIPHKHNAIRYLKEHRCHLDPLAEKIGAVNTFVFAPNGSVAGYNTDYIGVLETLRVSAGLNSSALKGKKVAVLGAGGVSRAILAGMTSAKADVTIFNRTESKAQALAADFNSRFAPWDRRNSFPFDILINGTSIGMHPHVDQSPIDADAIGPGTVVFDTVYNPLETRLLKYARQAGALAVNGADMLVYQAAAQIQLWLSAQRMENFSVPVDIMKEAVMSSLKKD